MITTIYTTDEYLYFYFSLNFLSYCRFHLMLLLFLQFITTTTMMTKRTIQNKNAKIKCKIK